MISRWVLIAVVIGTFFVSSAALAGQLEDRIAIWNRHAEKCEGYPTKWSDPAAPDGKCEDGDMTLFSGLLCAAGVTLGCQAVRASLEDIGPDPGRWFRSPRRKSNPAIGAGSASFSPDMALGAQLYLATTKDIAAGQLWYAWLDRHRPCLAGSEPNCDLALGPITIQKNVRGWPRFCTDDSPDRGCAMRPGDLTDLARTRWVLKFPPVPPPTCDIQYPVIADYFGALINVDMIIGKGLPYLLDVSCGMDISFNDFSAHLNEPGFPQHLVAVEVFLYRQLGIPKDATAGAAYELARKQPQNPFFAYLAGVSKADLEKLILNECPATDAAAAALSRTQWAWERADDVKAWKDSSLWDCIFMGELIRKMP